MENKGSQNNQSVNEYTLALLKLSRREGEVLKLFAAGKTNSEIADELYISIRTVENHRYRICKKLDIRGKGALEQWIEGYHNDTP